MRKSHLLLALVIGALLSPVLPAGAKAQQATQAQVVAACGTPNSTYPAGTTKPLTQDTAGKNCVNATVTATATTTATASSTPTAVGAGPNAPLNINLFSALFEQPTFGGTPVDGTHGLPVNCIVGCSGGTFNNNADGIATSSTNGQAAAWLYAWNGASWDRLQDDASKNLKVNIAAAIAAGTNVIGKVGIDQTTPGTTNGVQVLTGSTTAVTQATAANLNATVVGAGTAGSANAGVLTVQGIASMTKLLVTPDSVALPANQSVNVAQFGGSNAVTGTGAGGAGIPRVTISSDSSITGLAAGVTTSGTTGSGVMAATTTAPPSLTTGQTNFLSQDLNGGLRVAPACNKVINVTQTTTTDVHTFTGFGYICSIMLVSATAQSIGIDEGTGTTCETSGTALIGTSSTSSATPTLALAANGGFSMASGIPLMRMQASGDHICVLQSSTGNVSGTITYADLTN